MRVRAQDANGDYIFGRGKSEFLVNSSACVAQAVLTALKLFQGEWFLDNTAGMPWVEKVLGFNTQDVYDLAIKSLVLSMQGVQAINTYSSVLSASSRKLTVTMTIATQFGTTGVTAPVFVGLAPGGYGVGGFGLQGFGL